MKPKFIQHRLSKKVRDAHRRGKDTITDQNQIDPTWTRKHPTWTIEHPSWTSQTSDLNSPSIRGGQPPPPTSPQKAFTFANTAAGAPVLTILVHRSATCTNGPHLARHRCCLRRASPIPCLRTLLSGSITSSALASALFSYRLGLACRKGVSALHQEIIDC